jgi:hypothetical protein
MVIQDHVIVLQFLKRSNDKNMIEDFVTISSIHIHMEFKFHFIMQQLLFLSIALARLIFQSNFKTKMGIGQSY